MSSNGISTHTTVGIHHWELGRDFWKWGSDEQADFLQGMYTGMSEMSDGNFGFQLLSVHESGKLAGYERDLSELTHTLHTYLSPEA